MATFYYIKAEEEQHYTQLTVGTVNYRKLRYLLHSGNFGYKKEENKNFQRNHRNKQCSIPLRRGASVCHANRSNLHPIFIGAFQNCEQRLSASPRLYVRLYETIRLQANGLSRNLIRVFSENLLRKFKLIKI
jgi:hypothetical protein